MNIWLTLHHGSLPGWYLDDEGGHRDARARGRWWAHHVDRMAETFDGRVAGWCPIEDPIGWAVRGYGLASRPPGRADRQAMAEAAEGSMLALHEACRLLSSGSQPVMAVFGAPMFHAAVPDAAAATRLWDDLTWATWTRALKEGVLEVPGCHPRPTPFFSAGPDIVGISHDHPVGVMPDGTFTELARVRPHFRSRIRSRAGRAGRSDPPHAGVDRESLSGGGCARCRYRR